MVTNINGQVFSLFKRITISNYTYSTQPNLEFSFIGNPFILITNESNFGLEYSFDGISSSGILVTRDPPGLSVILANKGTSNIWLRTIGVNKSISVKIETTAVINLAENIIIPTETVIPSSQDRRPALGISSVVSSSTSNVTLLSSNINRLGATFFNDSTVANLFIKLGSSSSLTSFTVKLLPGGYYEVPYGYTGIIDGIWSVSSGSVKITETL